MEQTNCKYPHRPCARSVLDGYNYCKTHILLDVNCPYRQCVFISNKTGKRCTQAAFIKDRKEGYCSAHQYKITKARCRAAKRLRQPPTAESMLADLEHYSTTIYNNSGETKHNRAESSSKQLADLASSSDSEEELSRYNQGTAWLPDSDSESIDSEAEDIFKYADIMTAEEVTRITRDKLIRLQSLYIEQFKWLQLVLKERRRKYLNAQAAIQQNRPEGRSRFVLTDNADTDMYVASRRYHKHHGLLALMHYKYQQKRKKLADGLDTKHRHVTPRCSYKYSRCMETPIPLTKYCLKHMESDHNQVLFRKCGFTHGRGLMCRQIVPDMYDRNRCHLHANIEDLEAINKDFQSEQIEEFEHVEVCDAESRKDPPISASPAVAVEVNTDGW